MAEKDYSKREIDLFMREIKEALKSQDRVLAEIKAQTIKTNGRVNKHDRYFLVGGIVAGMLIIQNFPEIIKFVALFI